MPTPATVKTDWICIATSGDTADGRFIKKEWLTEMAANYDQNLYSAKLWLDHYRWPGSQGSVIALKTEKATGKELEGEIQLFAQVAPTDELIAENRAGRYRHASIEPLENFANKGFTYLGGLAFTDSPASLGTSEALFSKNKDLKSKDYFPGAAIAAGAFSSEEDGESVAEVKGLLTKFFNYLKSQDTQQEEEPMNDKQFSKLEETLTAQTTAITSLLEHFKKNPQKPEDGNGGASEEQNAAPAGGVTAEQFTAQSNEIKDLRTQIETFTQKLDDALKHKVPGTQSDDGTGNAEQPVF